MTNQIDIFSAVNRQTALGKKLSQISVAKLIADYNYSLFVNVQLETQKQIFNLFKANLI